MTSRTTGRFRRALQDLPPRVRTQARAAFRQFLADPQHPSLRLKQIHASKPIYSVRISRDYRALAVRTDDTMVWFWIGSHSEYDSMIHRL